jgi:hypothetical protein
MTSAEVDAAAERYYDRLLEEYQREDPEPWELADPGWEDIANMIEGFDWKRICKLTRDYVDGDGDLMTEAYNAGVLDNFIRPEENWMRKDPDDTWTLIDTVFEREWDKDALFKEIYKWLPENHVKTLCERLIKRADYNGIREEYNEQHMDDWRGRE